MNLVAEILYPNNARRPLRPTDAEGTQQQKSLEAYKLAGLLPNEIQAMYATGKFWYGSAWKDPDFWGFVGPRKTWQSPTPVRVIVPARNADGSYKMADFVAGTSFDFSLWSRAQADFANSAYGRFFPQLPIMEAQVFNQEAAAAMNYGPGPSADYPIQMGPVLFPRFDGEELRWFNMADFRAANPIVGESSHIIPTGAIGVPDAMLVDEIGKIARNTAATPRQRLDMIRQMLGAPIPLGNQQRPAD